MLDKKRKPAETPPPSRKRPGCRSFSARDRPTGRSLFPRSSFYDRPNEASAPSFDLGIFTTFSSASLSSKAIVFNGHAGDGNV